MKCLHCGHCCKNYPVAIVDDPSKGLREDNLVMNPGDGNPCKHLKTNPKTGKYDCAVHKYPWYKETPCYRHGQVEANDDCECRLGKYLLNKDNQERAKQIQAEAEEFVKNSQNNLTKG